MACTFDDAAIRAIIDTDITPLTPFIDCTTVLVGPDGCDLAGKGVGADAICCVSLYLAAHLITISDPRVLSTRSSGHAVTFEGLTKLGLDSSKFGQQAKLLDPTGCLAGLDREGRLPFIFSATQGSVVDADAQPFIPRGGFGFP